MNLQSTMDELVKLCAVSDEEAQAALDRLHSTQKSIPTRQQALRYGTIGVIGTPAIAAIAQLATGQPVFGGGGIRKQVQDATGKAIAGGLGASAIPMLRNHYDRVAEEDLLRKYLKENDPEFGKYASAEATYWIWKIASMILPPKALPGGAMHAEGLLGALSKQPKTLGSLAPMANSGHIVDDALAKARLTGPQVGKVNDRFYQQRMAAHLEGLNRDTASLRPQVMPSIPAPAPVPTFAAAGSADLKTVPPPRRRVG